ncbi:UNVERIFIED_CONTAM: putative membrane protein [Williamsia faeni]
MTVWRESVLVVGVVTVGLMAGLYSAFSYAVMPALRRVDDKTFVAAIQRINVAIVNPLFLLIFFGGIGFTAVAAVLYRDQPMLWWIVAGAVLYGVTLVITVAFNIPLNNQIAAAGDPDRISDLPAVREAFEDSWVRWNIVRAVASTAALAVLATGLATQ